MCVLSMQTHNAITHNSSDRNYQETATQINTSRINESMNEYMSIQKLEFRESESDYIREEQNPSKGWKTTFQEF
nr:hypothetical protein Itr_chr02CG18340 [Ipomoea trifida]